MIWLLCKNYLFVAIQFISAVHHEQHFDCLPYFPGFFPPTLLALLLVIFMPPLLGAGGSEPALLNLFL
tara:strand:- start:583 stop:786 length:204 start_codon:yes stop_codon:yes gene_type:complete